MVTQVRSMGVMLQGAGLGLRQLRGLGVEGWGVEDSYRV